MPDVALTTDIIVGHPGETRAHFESTLALAEEIRFDKIHLAMYSARPGTRAAAMELDPALAISEDEKNARRIELEGVQTRIATELNARLRDQEVEVLVEGEHKGKWRGRTPGNKLVFFADSADWIGRLARVRITQTGPWSLQGRLIGEGATG
jgi:tRNA-2-methylthio-N6-dimethylallyladenosine synthase